MELLKIEKGMLYLLLVFVSVFPFFTLSNFTFPFVTSKAILFFLVAEILFGLWILYIAHQPQAMQRMLHPILYTVTVFLGVIVVASVFGRDWNLSMWSYPERMSGIVTLVHTLLFVLALVTILTREMWIRILRTTSVVSIVVGVFVLLNAASDALTSGITRVDIFFGNPNYVAFYLLLHVGIMAFLLLERGNSLKQKYIYKYGLVIVLSALMLTGSRAALLGVIVAAGWGIALAMRRRHVTVQRAIVGGIVIISVIGGTLFMHSGTIRPDVMMEGLKNESRFIVWPMAMDGFLERPWLGHGLETFEYVFYEQYDPRLYNKESWFDRTHNLFLDWLVMTGIIGLGVYLFLLIVIIRSIRTATVTTTQRAVLYALTCAIIVFQLFGFHVLSGYVFLALLLAFLISISHPIESLTRDHMVTRARWYWVGIVVCIVLPLLIVLPMSVAFTRIAATQEEPDNATVPPLYAQAFQYSTIAAVDVRYMTDGYTDARRILSQLPEHMPARFRWYYVVGRLYSQLKEYEKALQYLNRAVQLAPSRLDVRFDRGHLLLVLERYGDAEKDFTFIQQHARLYNRAEMWVLVSAIRQGDFERAQALMENLQIQELRYNDAVLSAYAAQKKYDMVATLWDVRLNEKSSTAQEYIHAAVAQYTAGNVSRATELITEAMNNDPNFEETGSQIIRQMWHGTFTPR